MIPNEGRVGKVAWCVVRGAWCVLRDAGPGMATTHDTKHETRPLPLFKLTVTV